MSKPIINTSLPPISKSKIGRLRRWRLFLPLAALLSAGIYFLFFWGEVTRQEKLANIAGQFDSEPYFSGLDNNPDQPLSPVPTQVEFRPLEIEASNFFGKRPNPTLNIDLSKGPSGQEIESLALTLPALNLGKTGSMMPSDPAVLPEFHPKNDSSPNELANERFNVRLGISRSYSRVYGLAVDELPSDLRGKTISLGLLPGRRRAPTSQMQQILSIFSALFHNNQASARFTFSFSDLPGQSDYDLDAIQPAYSYVKHFSADLDAAASLIKQHHPELHLANLRVLLRDDLLIEQSVLDEVDLWQDAGACAAVGCPQAESFAQHSARYPIEYHLWGQSIEYPLWLWRPVSLTKKYDLMRQGIGPSQIIIGLAEKAGGDRELVRDYQPHLSSSDFAGTDAIVRAALDPQKAIYLRALSLDFVLSQIENTTFSDSFIRHPADHPPYISNPETAREYGLLNLAYQMLVYPELDFLAVPMLTKGDGRLYLRHFATGRLFGIEPEYPGLFFVSMNAHRRRSIYFHYKLAANAMGTD